MTAASVNQKHLVAMTAASVNQKHLVAMTAASVNQKHLVAMTAAISPLISKSETFGCYDCSNKSIDQ